jgi:hypothetical protein
MKTITYHVFIWCFLILTGLFAALFIDRFTIEGLWWNGFWTGVRQSVQFALWTAAIIYETKIRQWIRP